jgi:ABC-type transport system substrate-binding protein/DNA-binding SARP family transcriptional activator/DNA-binding beta-propeller fold protein YncE
VAEQGRPVPRDELAEALWGENLPATWDKALSVLVSKLRVLLAEHGIDGSTALTGAFGCYRLELPEGSWIDVLAAASAVEEAEEAIASGDLERAKAAAAVAASLVREPFLPAEEGAWVEQKRRELTEVRLRALDVLVDASLRSDEPQQAAKWAEQAVTLEPFRESGYRRLMEAHIAAGNRAEALRVYERCRRLLADELGAYPSPETESTYRGLLETPAAAAVGASLEPTERLEPKPPARRSPSRKQVVVAAALVALAAGLAAGIVATRSGATHTAVAANSIVALRQSGSIAATVPVGARPVAITSGAGSLWVANFDDQTVTRVDLASRRAVRAISIGAAPTGLAATSSAVWVTDGGGDLSKIDPSYNQLSGTKRLAAATAGFYGASAPRPTLSAFGSIWVVDPDGYVSRVDRGSLRRVASVDVGNDPSAIAAGAGSVWVANNSDGTVIRIDPKTLLTTTIPVGHGPTGVALNSEGAWIANAGDDTVVRLNTETNAVVGTTRVGDGPIALLATPNAVWVANREGTVMRLDPRSGKVNKVVRVGGSPDALVSAGGRVWVAVAPAPPPQPRTGGVARLTLGQDLSSYDPALTSVPPLLYATCANLVSYPDRPMPEGSRIVPEVAEAVPAPTDGGKTYTFRIRPGFRFSPPSNEAVTAATFKSTIERVTDPRMRSLYAGQLSGIVGYRAYVEKKVHRLAGVVARGRTLTIRLTKPDGGFLANLASGAVCAVPPQTPATPINGIPSAGPYYIASYTPRQQIVLERNPNYHGERPRHFDRFVIAIGVNSSHALAEVEVGKADYALEGLPREAGPELERTYGPGSKAAKGGHQQYFTSEALAARFLHMNASRPLFSHVRLRQAVNYAIDRAALVAQGRRFAEVNPFNAGKPSDELLPTAIEGATDPHLYPLRPDLARAKRLAGDVHATAIMYTPNTPPWLQEAQIVRRDLRPLGIDVQVKEFPIGDFYERVMRRGEPFDLAVSGWSFANTDPAPILAMFSGDRNGAASGPNLSHFHDRVFDRELEAASRLSGTKRYRAYDRLTRELERDLAPAAPFATDASRDFFSARIGCQTYQPVYGMDLAALCLRPRTTR